MVDFGQSSRCLVVILVRTGLPYYCTASVLAKIYCFTTTMFVVTASHRKIKPTVHRNEHTTFLPNTRSCALTRKHTSVGRGSLHSEDKLGITASVPQYGIATVNCPDPMEYTQLTHPPIRLQLIAYCSLSHSVLRVQYCHVSSHAGDAKQ